MFSLEQNGKNLMISLEIDLERFGTHLKHVQKAKNSTQKLTKTKAKLSQAEPS